MKKNVMIIMALINFYFNANAQNIYTKDIVKDVRDRKIVAIGEDTHSTKEFQIIRSLLSKDLIMNKDFNIVVLENPSDDMLALNESLTTTRNIDSLMKKHLFAIYQTKEMKDFLIWIKEYNSKSSKKILLKGCDDSRFIAVKMLKDKCLKLKLDNELFDQIAELNDKINLPVSDYCFKYNKVEDKSENNFYSFNASTYDLAIDIEANLTKLGIKDPTVDELINEIKINYLKYKKWSQGKFVSRDEIMADRILFHANNPNNKIIVLAHNAHISKKDIIENEIGLMGKIIEEQLPNQYFSLGLMSARGSYSYIENRFINDNEVYNDTLLNTDFSKLNQQSWNNYLSKKGRFKNKYIDSNKINKISAENMTMRLIGYGKENNGKDYYPVSKISDIYDAIIFLEYTEHSNSI